MSKIKKTRYKLNSRNKKNKWIILIALTVTINIFTHNLFSVQNNFVSSAVFAQTLTPEVVSEKVYQQIPDFPLENNYVSVETKEIASANTIITRIVRYHQYTKARPTIFRLDWKLTLADYLGKNEIIDENRYPRGTLTENPLESDRKVIRGLSREQRDQLVRVLVSIYNPETNSHNSQESPPSQGAQPSNNTPSLVLPQPGGANLLLE